MKLGTGSFIIPRQIKWSLKMAVVIKLSLSSYSIKLCYSNIDGDSCSRIILWMGEKLQTVHAY